MKNLSIWSIHLSPCIISIPPPGTAFKPMGLVPEERAHTLPPPTIPGGANRAEVRVICNVAAHGGAPS